MGHFLSAAPLPSSLGFLAEIPRYQASYEIRGLVNVPSVQMRATVALKISLDSNKDIHRVVHEKNSCPAWNVRIMMGPLGFLRETVLGSNSGE